MAINNGVNVGNSLLGALQGYNSSNPANNAIAAKLYTPPAPATASPSAPPAPSVSSGPSPAQIAAQQAAAAQVAAQAKAQANYDNIQNADMSAIHTNIDAGASGYNQGILDYFNQGPTSVYSQQNAINASGVQNELARDQGLQGVRDMINNGVQGAGVVLDNANAGTSSAGDAVARAYGIQGRQQASHVGNQYAQGQNTINTQQQDLNNSVATYVNHDAPFQKSKTVNDIVQDASSKLTYLGILAQQTANPAQVGDIAARIADIKAQATSALSNYDNVLGQQQAANTPASQEFNQAKASNLFSQGTAPAKAFDFTNEAPATLQNTGPAASNLPIYIAPSNKNNLPAPV